MPPKPKRMCESCHKTKAMFKRRRTGQAVCIPCFCEQFETEVHMVITKFKLFKRGEVVALGVSGGKDSTVLLHIMDTLNKRYDYGLNLQLLSIDEGITGYRDDSLDTVKQNEADYGIPLRICSYEDLYGWTMDRIVKEIGKKNNCTFCGVFRRQALDRGAALIKADKLVTGHNADDVAETVLMNIMRGDVARLQRCTAIVTGDDASGIPRSKPFKYCYQFEIVAYAKYKKLVYFSTECIYSPEAFRGNARSYMKELESIRPRAVMDIIHAGENMTVKKGIKMPRLMKCERCDYISSNSICKACVLLEGLNKGMPKISVGKTSRIKKMMINTKPSATTSAATDLSDEMKGLKVEVVKEAVNDVDDSCGAGDACCGSGKCKNF